MDLDDPAAILATWDTFDYAIGTDPDDYFVRVGATDITDAIREPRVTAVVSAIARVRRRSRSSPRRNFGRIHSNAPMSA